MNARNALGVLADVAAILVFGALAARGVMTPGEASGLILAVISGRLFPKAAGTPPTPPPSAPAVVTPSATAPVPSGVLTLALAAGHVGALALAAIVAAGPLAARGRPHLAVA